MLSTFSVPHAVVVVLAASRKVTFEEKIMKRWWSLKKDRRICFFNQGIIDNEHELTCHFYNQRIIDN